MIVLTDVAGINPTSVTTMLINYDCVTSYLKLNWSPADATNSFQDNESIWLFSSENL